MYLVDLFLLEDHPHHCKADKTKKACDEFFHCSMRNFALKPWPNLAT